MSYADGKLHFHSVPTPPPVVGPTHWFANAIMRQLKEGSITDDAKYVKAEDYHTMMNASENVAMSMSHNYYLKGRAEGLVDGAVGTVAVIIGLFLLVFLSSCSAAQLKQANAVVDEVHAVRKGIEAIPGVKEAVDSAFPEMTAIRAGLDAGYYVVKAGDTLWGISKSQLGDAQLWPTLMGAGSDVDDPDNITPGDQVTINKNLTDADKARARRFAQAYAAGMDVPDLNLGSVTLTSASTEEDVVSFSSVTRSSALTNVVLNDISIGVTINSPPLIIMFSDDPKAWPVVIVDGPSNGEPVMMVKVTDSASTTAQPVRTPKPGEPALRIMLAK